MKLISKILVAITVLLSFTASNAQIKNAKIETVKVYGNCEMCKSKIEKAGNLKRVSNVTWDEKTKLATLTFNSKKTNQDEILKRIALVGYDSDKFLAPNATYLKLPGCCQYDREAKVNEKINVISQQNMPLKELNVTTNNSINSITQLKPIFDNYFELKDALIKTDGKLAFAKATELLTGVKAVKMETLGNEEHIVWMKVLAPLKEHTEHIAETQDPKHQRDHFDSLSLNIYDLIKVSKQETPTYYQYCPMANDGKGATWLSKENVVKNPYYGSMMLSCGKVTETIK